MSHPVHTAEVVALRRLSEKTFELELTRPPSFVFSAGQRIRLVTEHGERDYSLVSGPSQETLILCIRGVEGGVLSPRLSALQMGDILTFSGPHGYFVYRPSGRQPVFVATGTGIAPFVSMARSGVRGFVLLHGVSMPGELYYQSLFETTPSTYVPCISRAPDGPSSGGLGAAMFRGRVTTYIRNRLRSGVYDFYLCGREEMIRDATHLVDERFGGSHVYTEIFF